MERETFDADRVLDLFKSIMHRGRDRFPEHTREQIHAALVDEATRSSMFVQLLLLCDIGTRGVYRTVKVMNGRLVYTNGDTFVAWGTRTLLIEDGFSMKDATVVQLVGDRPCWIERCRATGEERVNWAGRAGKLYPKYSIETPIDCGGVPCYAVNDCEVHPSVGFLVVDEAEGEHHQRIRDLGVVGGTLAYVACDAQRATFVWDGKVVCEGGSFGRRVVIDGVPYVTVRALDFRRRELWAGRELLLTAHDTEGPSVVNGRLAYATVDRAGAGDEHVTRVSIGDAKYEHAGWTTNWWTPSDTDALFVAYSVCDGTAHATYANGVKLCDRRPQPNGFRLLEDGFTLRVRIEGEREPVEFDLKDLGVL